MGTWVASQLDLRLDTLVIREYWYDFCKDEMVLIPDEGVLIVVGVPEQFVQPPLGIRLRLLMYTESSWLYELETER